MVVVVEEEELYLRLARGVRSIKALLLNSSPSSPPPLVIATIRVQERAI